MGLLLGLVVLVGLQLVEGSCPYAGGADAGLSNEELMELMHETMGVFHEIEEDCVGSKFPSANKVARLLKQTEKLHDQSTGPDTTAFQKAQSFAIYRFLAALDAYYKKNDVQSMMVAELALQDALSVPDLHPHQEDPLGVSKLIPIKATDLMTRLAQRCQCIPAVSKRLAQMYKSFPQEKERAEILGRVLGLDDDADVVDFTKDISKEGVTLEELVKHSVPEDSEDYEKTMEKVRQQLKENMKLEEEEESKRMEELDKLLREELGDRYDEELEKARSEFWKQMLEQPAEGPQNPLF
eukprot:CAMPEP_0119152916 /NCGR_PEP_ID=MMETSP1310-20130426/48467_1 /TAXON_ID=464262 /ORGANISM="Genus nov. species nov., Strain RCC2339" /LENGTH=295 /DNA_ID=CAMNT_0007145327 /DNA_START=37 /DNA_END=924 /DNA_ORIENTATION=-